MNLDIDFLADDFDNANYPDLDTPLPPTQAAEAAPYIRKIFGIIRDPKVEGLGRSSEYHVPPELRAFVTDYLARKGYAIRFFSGSLTEKSYLTVAPKGDQ